MHTRKIPVKLVNLFFAQPTLIPSSNNKISHKKKGQRFKLNSLNSVVSFTLHIDRCCDLHIK